MVIPPRLSMGDEIRVISPSRSMAMKWFTQTIRKVANKRFEELGFKLTFGKNVTKIDRFNSSGIDDRLEDLHDAFSDPNVKAIMATIGGYNSIELIPYIDYCLIKNNPKIFCGYSDITALQNAIYAKAGLLTYSGPHYFDFGEELNFEYSLKYFKKCLLSNKPYKITPSGKWSDSLWGKDQVKRAFQKNPGYLCITPGKATGIIIGGNFSTIQLLRGTKFWPASDRYLLFVEADDDYSIDYFNRNLVSFALDRTFQNCRGIVIGRFQKASAILPKDIKKIIWKNHHIYKSIPIISGVDFGHTTPKITYPIGGKARIISNSRECKIEVLIH